MRHKWRDYKFPPKIEQLHVQTVIDIGGYLSKIEI
jgi:hypothetical protein